MKRILLITLLLVGIIFSTQGQIYMSTACGSARVSIVELYPSAKVECKDSTLIVELDLKTWSDLQYADINDLRTIAEYRGGMNILASIFTEEIRNIKVEKNIFYFIQLIFKDNSKHNFKKYIADKQLIL